MDVLTWLRLVDVFLLEDKSQRFFCPLGLLRKIQGVDDHCLSRYNERLGDQFR